MAEAPNYHISLWSDPPGGPATYLCLRCNVKDQTHEDILTHVTTVHALEPVPTPLAADASLAPALLRGEVPNVRRSADVPRRDE